MRNIIRICVVLLAAFVARPAWSETLTDEQVRERMIAESIASYPGDCPCPYNLARNGSRCGGRSAWSKAGRHEPLCFPDDIGDEEVRSYRERHDLSVPSQ